jgi:hypothetical protein
VRKGYFLFFLRHGDWVIALILAFGVALLDVFGWASPSVAGAATLLVLGAVLATLARSRFAVLQLNDATESLPRKVLELTNTQVLVDAKRLGLSRILTHTVNYDWDSKIKGSRDVVMVRMRLNLAERVQLLRAFEDVLDRNGSVTIVIPDPRSPAMWLRYMEEPKMHDDTVGTEVAWTRGLEELALEVSRLDRWLRSLSRSNKNIARLQIKLISAYPVQAFLKFDKAIYTYPYPYLHRGYHGPAFSFEDDTSPTYAFMQSCIRSLVNSGVLLDEIAVRDIVGKYKLGLFADRVVEKSAIVVAKRT